MTSSANIFEYRDHWQGPVALSTILHTALFGGAILFAVINGSTGENWGGTSLSDGAIQATLVSSAVPLPSTEANRENLVANDSKGMSESVPRPQVPEPEAIPIPDRIIKTKPLQLPRTPTMQKPKPEIKEQATNIVPFGDRGPVSGPYTMFKSDVGSGGLTLGGGGFGSRYSWYVDAVRRKISENWLKYEVDPSIASAKRVYLVFEITRNGQPSNVQVTQSSGVPSLDQSAMRALQRIDTFGPLPNDYAGNRVGVEFWFDYKR